MNLPFKMTMLLLLVQEVSPPIDVKPEDERKRVRIDIVQKSVDFFKTFFWIAVSILTALLIGRLN